MKLLSEREEKALKIAANPTSYMVCEGCDSILNNTSAICPNCHSYRFDTSPSRVVTQAKLLGSRDQKTVTASDLY